jgi:hypothetical protein
MNSGELSVHFTNSVLVTVVVALFVLWRYRRAILVGMRQGKSLALPLPAASQPALRSLVAGDLAGLERAMRWRISAAWLLTTFACGLPMAIAYQIASNFGFSPTYSLGLTMCYMVAALPMIAVSLALPPTRIILGLAAMLLGFAAIFLTSGMLQRSIGGRPLNWHMLGMVPLFFGMVWNQLWMAGIFWLLSWPGRLRGVVPITFAALLVFGFAPFIGSRLTAALAETEFGTPWVMRLGLNGIFMLIALPVGWLAWLRLRRMARDFEAKRFSDAQLLARMWWLFLAVTVGADIYIARDQPIFALLLTLGEILLFGPVNHAAMRLLGVASTAAAGPAPTLLLLRMFGYTARTERLFDRVAARWRLIGPVTMIAAPDVSARVIDAGDYLRWLTGRMDELFITSRASLDARLAALDLRPDQDGRFRINEFCCRDSTWRASVVELMLRADAVIMDVRGITSEQRGCEFELQQLAQRLSPKRLVFVIDDSTDQAVLQAAFGPTLSEVRMVEVRRSWHADRAFAALLEAAG